MVTMTTPLLAPVGAPQAIAVSSPGGSSVTYADLAARSHSLARLLTSAGLRTGDRLATLTWNTVDQVVLFYACAEAGLVLVPLSWRATPTELAGMIAVAQPSLLATDAEHAGLAARTVAQRGEPLPAVLLGTTGIERAVPPINSTLTLTVTSAREPSPDDPVLLLFTSGSSGRPKGVLLSQASCLATNEALASRFPLTVDDTVLLMLPQFHVAAWNVQPLLAWSVGARVIVLPSFDPDVALDTITRERVTTMMAVPTIYETLTSHPDFERRDLSSLRTAVVGGAPVDESLGSAWDRRGVRLWAGYGLTEAGPNVLCEPPDGPKGWLMPYDGVEVRRDAIGQLLVRGPGLFSGYWRDAEATAKAMRDDWLATGDIAEESHGRFRLRGRSNERYISGGENVHPAEVERALRLLGPVAESAVIGVPDERWGEAGVAFVVPRADQHPSPEQLRAELRDHLSGYKVPREIVVLDALPLTDTGKVDKRALQQSVQQNHKEQR